jgi:N-acetylglucosamine-6-sulfatase
MYIFDRILPKVAVAGISLIPFISESTNAEDSRPNIIVIVVDDMRYDQMSNEGHPYIQTPNLDRLCKEGVKFTQAYVSSPVCGPVRASLFTGQHASAHGRYNNFVYPKSFEIYLPRSFKEQGYRTAMIGKFYEGQHLVDEYRGKVYDRWFQNHGPDWKKFTGDKKDPKARKDFYNKNLYYDQCYVVDKKGGVVKKGHQTDVLFDEAARFASEKSDKPFFISMCPFAPHGPHNPSKKRLGKYKGKGIPPRQNQVFDKGYMAKHNCVKRFADISERSCEMIEDIDEALGRLIETLKKNGQLDNTILIFSSDNGVVMGEHGFGWKMHPWEESIRIPLIVRFPKLAKPGTTCDALISITDFFVTCADIAGVKLPDDKFRYGRSFKPLLTGKKKQIRDSLLLMQFEQLPNGKKESSGTDVLVDWYSIRNKAGYKFVVYRDSPRQRPELGKEFLFNLKNDEYEMKNLSSNPEYGVKKKELIIDLKKQLKANKAEYDAVDK